jgi:hypothetical protein
MVGWVRLEPRTCCAARGARRRAPRRRGAAAWACDVITRARDQPEVRRRPRHLLGARIAMALLGAHTAHNGSSSTRLGAHGIVISGPSKTEGSFMSFHVYSVAEEPA